MKGQDAHKQEDLLISETVSVVKVVDLLAASGLARSKGEARRLVQQGGIRLNGEKVKSIEEVVTVEEEAVLQVGKRKFMKLVASSAKEES